MKNIVVSFCVLSILALGGNSAVATDNGLISWKEQRDLKVEKQSRDFSCGVAALATVLQLKFNESVSEEALLERLNNMKGMTENVSQEIKYYSLLDLKKLAESLGYKAQGLALSFAGLRKIDKPVIVYVEPRGINHFSVLTEVDDNYVYLADPSWGNVKYIHEKFIELWRTRKESIYYGRVLVVKK